MAKTTDERVCVAMGNLGLKLERIDSNESLTFDEKEHKYTCKNDKGVTVECCSVTTVLSEHIFPKFDADKIINTHNHK
jgi:hypothetical protein